jgi:hypothetical protein
MAQFCKDYVLAMEVCAEGAHVDLGVLPSLLKCRSHIVILARESTTEITILNTELSTFDVDSSSELGDIHLLFRPGHYDLLYPLSVLEPDDFSVPVTASPEQASAAQVSSLESLQPHNATPQVNTEAAGKNSISAASGNSISAAGDAGITKKNPEDTILSAPKNAIPSSVTMGTGAIPQANLLAESIPLSNTSSSGIEQDTRDSFSSGGSDPSKQTVAQQLQEMLNISEEAAIKLSARCSSIEAATNYYFANQALFDEASTPPAGSAPNSNIAGRNGHSSNTSNSSNTTSSSRNGHTTSSIGHTNLSSVNNFNGSVTTSSGASNNAPLPLPPASNRFAVRDQPHASDFEDMTLLTQYQTVNENYRNSHLIDSIWAVSRLGYSMRTILESVASTNYACDIATIVNECKRRKDAKDSEPPPVPGRVRTAEDVRRFADFKHEQGIRENENADADTLVWSLYDAGHDMSRILDAISTYGMEKQDILSRLLVPSEQQNDHRAVPDSNIRGSSGQDPISTNSGVTTRHHGTAQGPVGACNGESLMFEGEDREVFSRAKHLYPVIFGMSGLEAEMVKVRRNGFNIDEIIDVVKLYHRYHAGALKIIDGFMLV